MHRHNDANNGCGSPGGDAINQDSNPSLQPSCSQEDLRAAENRLNEDAPLEVFDLKGSWVSRSTLQDGDPSGGGSSANPHGKRHSKRTHTMKDNDLREKLYFNDAQRERFQQHLTKDAAFLQGEGIMDYSLLLGIEKGLSEMECQVGVDENPLVMSASNSFTAQRYYVGIIDILQKWDRSKRTERYLKALAGQDLDGVSACAPEVYEERFVRKMMGHVYSPPSAAALPTGSVSSLTASISGATTRRGAVDDNASDRALLGLGSVGGSPARVGSSTARPLVRSGLRPIPAAVSLSSGGSEYSDRSSRPPGGTSMPQLDQVNGQFNGASKTAAQW